LWSNALRRGRARFWVVPVAAAAMLGLVGVGSAPPAGAAPAAVPNARIYSVPSQMTVQPGSEFTFEQRMKIAHDDAQVVEADLEYPPTNYWMGSDATSSPMSPFINQGGGGATDLVLAVFGTSTVTGDIHLANTTFRARCHPGTYRISYADTSVVAGPDDTQSVLTKATGPRVSVSLLDPSKLCIEQGYRAQGSSTNVTFYGSGFTGSSTIAFATPGISASVSRVVSPNKLIAHVVVDAGATLGDSAATITSVSGSLSCTACFTVTKSPSISSIDPSSAPRGSSTPLDIRGGPFYKNTKVIVSGGGISLSPPSGSQGLRGVTVTIARHVKTGVRDVTVVNADGGRATCAGCLTVT
jgi:hypothetical protein